MNLYIVAVVSFVGMIIILVEELDKAAQDSIECLKQLPINKTKKRKVFRDCSDVSTRSNLVQRLKN